MSSAAPRRITGSPGSRVRVILGEDSDEWLLLLNKDDGNSEWQAYNWSSSIPAKIAKQLNNLSNKNRYCKEIDFGPGGSWFIHGIRRDGSGGHSWWSAPHRAKSLLAEWAGNSTHRLQATFGTNAFGDESFCLLQGSNGHYCNAGGGLVDILKEVHQRNGEVHFVRLFHDGGYFISYDRANAWNGLGRFCGNELKKTNKKVEDLAVAGDGSWIIIHPNDFLASRGTDQELTDALGTFYHDQKSWQSRRGNEIRIYNQQQRERQEREARETAEREAAEREAAERQAAEREAAEREAAEKEAAKREAAEREAAVKRTVLLESKLEEVLLQEKKSIEEMESHLENRKRSLLASVKTLPPQKHARFRLASGSASNTAPCVVCHDSAAVVAVIPCGHHCLCCSCSSTLVSKEQESRNCPLCRAPIKSMHRIFTNSANQN